MSAVLEEEKFANNWFRLEADPGRQSVPDTRKSGNRSSNQPATAKPFTSEEEELYHELTLYRYGSYYS